MIPAYWQEFVSENKIVGCDFELSEDDDLSDLGADLKLMTAEQIISEATEFYPGIAAVKEGFIPVGMCLTGSGDYYYIQTSDGKDGPLYRVYHDAVNDESLVESGVDMVLKSYTSLLGVKCP